MDFIFSNKFYFLVFLLIIHQIQTCTILTWFFEINFMDFKGFDGGDAWPTQVFVFNLSRFDYRSYPPLTSASHSPFR